MRFRMRSIILDLEIHIWTYSFTNSTIKRISDQPRFRLSWKSRKSSTFEKNIMFKGKISVYILQEHLLSNTVLPADKCTTAFHTFCHVALLSTDVMYICSFMNINIFFFPKKNIDIHPSVETFSYAIHWEKAFS
ncbi:hypothetical protein KP509_27G037100 [Ceratopteris richardii]|uniref:Uncharacterized protein n=1 Tax=Ceratopteris richardii TaxID=49495 RepID=A0A8T2RHM1_CERRI|nr:hypothetical protein KP509_27G037100 [Ceratopteris richardii]